MRTSRMYAWVMLAALLVLSPACGRKAPTEIENKAPARPQAAASAAGAAGLRDAENIFMQVSRDVMPSVVNIRTFQKVDAGGMMNDQRMPRDQYHDFGNKNRKPHTEPSFGSGVIISADGYILTNAHVVANASEINVKLTDKREFAAKLVGSDAKTDVAVLKIDSKEPLPKANLGDSSNLQIGQWAIAIGNPFGLDRTLTVGVVSGVGRADVGVTHYESFIQTDASVNPGNSGGPLLNSKGEVIGINTAIMSAGQGISFAIPVNMAKDIAKSLIEQGKVVRGWLGVGIQTLTPELAEGLGMRGRSGVLVNRVYKDSPSEKAGFRVRDVVFEFNGVAVSESHQLQNVVAGTQAGKAVNVKVFRDGADKTLKVRLGEMGDFEAREMREKKKTESTTMLGLTVHPVDSGALGLDFKGVVVVEVEGDSGAEKAGVMAGDVIQSIGKYKVEGLKDFKSAAERVKKGDSAVVLVMRARNPLFIAFKNE